MAKETEVKSTENFKNPLYTIKDKSLNQIGKTAIAYLGNNKLSATQIVQFRLLKRKPNPDPQKKAGAYIYPNITLRLQFWINDKENGVTEIAAVQSLMPNGDIRYQKFHVDGAETKEGMFLLYGADILHQKIYPYLLMSPENASSPFCVGEEGKENALYEIVDAKREAKINVNRVSALRTALTAIENMDDSDLILFNSALGGKTTDEPEEMIDRLNKLAMANPLDFIQKIDAQEMKVKALIRQALESNIIQYDTMQHRYLWIDSQETIATLDRVDGVDEVALFAEWLITSKDGEKIQKMIKQLIK